MAVGNHHNCTNDDLEDRIGDLHHACGIAVGLCGHRADSPVEDATPVG